MKLWRARLAFAVLIWVEVEEISDRLFWRLLEWAGPVIEPEIAKRRAAAIAEIRAVLMELQVK
jgi:hypothetical protein